MSYFDTAVLEAVELDKFVGLSANYTITGEDGSVVTCKTKHDRIVHPDLVIAFGALHDFVAHALGFPEGYNHTFDDDIPLLSLRGMQFADDGKVQFTALIYGPMGSYKAKTPKVYPPEDIKSLVKAAANEVLLFLDGKGSELSLFGDAGNEAIAAVDGVSD